MSECVCVCVCVCVCECVGSIIIHDVSGCTLYIVCCVAMLVLYVHMYMYIYQNSIVLILHVSNYSN